MKSALTILLTAFALPWAGFGQIQSEKPKEYTPESLLKLASVTLSKETESFILSTNFGVQAWFPRPIIGWKAPDQSIMLWLDTRDGTPMAVSFGDKSLFYDPRHMLLHSLEISGINCKLKFADKKLTFSFSSPSDPQVVDFDFGSILNELTDLSVSKGDKGGPFQLEGVSKRGNKGRAIVDPNASIPLMKISLYSGADEEVAWFNLNGDPKTLDASVFDFPSDALKAKKIWFRICCIPIYSSLLAFGKPMRTWRITAIPISSKPHGQRPRSCSMLSRKPGVFKM